MTTTVVFEAGTIADCVKKAARVAPSKVGSAFDKAAGIVFDIAPGTEAPCVVRATDTEVFYMETVNVSSADGPACRWRLPSQLLANVIGNIPSTAGKIVTFSSDGTQVKVSSGRMRATINVNANPYYPEWDAIDGLSLRVAPNFGGNVTRVEWAASKTGPAPLNGVYLDGEYLLSSDRYRIARVPCKIDLPDGPVTIPAWSIGSLLKQMGDVLVGMDGNLFVAMPDDYTQIKVVILGDKFPPINKITSIEFSNEVKFNRLELIEKINKATQFSGADRTPLLNLYIGREEIAVMMNNHEIGMFGDVVEVSGQADHSRLLITFTPKMLLDALINAPNDSVTIKYNTDNVKLPILVDGDSGYEAWVAPRAQNSP